MPLPLAGLLDRGPCHPGDLGSILFRMSHLPDAPSQEDRPPAAATPAVLTAPGTGTGCGTRQLGVALGFPQFQSRTSPSYVLRMGRRGSRLPRSHPPLLPPDPGEPCASPSLDGSPSGWIPSRPAPSLRWAGRTQLGGSRDTLQPQER